MHVNSTASEPPLAAGQAKAEARATAGVDDILGGEAIPSQRAAFLELLKGLGVYAQDCVAKWGPVRRQLAAPKPSRVRVPS